MKWTVPKNTERRLFGKARFKIFYVFSRFVVCYASRSDVEALFKKAVSIANSSLNNILYNNA